MSKTMSPEAQAVSADLQQVLRGEDGLKTKVSGDIYYEHGAKAGFERDTIDGVKKHDRTFAAGTMDAVAKVGLEFTKASGTKEAISVTVPAAKGEEITATFTPHASGEMKGAEGQPAKPWDSYGGLRAVHKTVVRGAGGDMGAAIAASKEAAEAVFKAK